MLIQSLLAAFLFSFAATAAIEPPRHSTGLTDAVQWDNYTLFIHQQRVFLHGGEFHTFRLPSPDLWLDIFQKMVAAGLNSVSIYIHWGLSNPSPDLVDFNDWRALQPIFDAASLAGIFVVFRPGPYINAETTAGGLALWSTSITSSTLRTNATDILKSWTPYIEEIDRAAVPNQVDRGGPIVLVQVDNEYSQQPIENAEYFAQIEDSHRRNGITVPLTYNDPGQRSNFINGTGAPDLYGSDAYPNRFDCSTPEIWHSVTLNYHNYHELVNPGMVWYMPEFQGGSQDAWGGRGYDFCYTMTNSTFEDVFYKHNWASNAKMLSYYMFYGGANWGGIAEPAVYSSYDYGASLRQTRELTPKFDELKRQGLFLRSSPDFRKTDWIGNSNVTVGIPGVSFDNNLAFGTLLRNPDTGAGFLIVRQTNSSSLDKMAFTVTLPTSRGSITVPRRTKGRVELRGRQSKVILTDYAFGNHGFVLYSTANVLIAGVINGRDILFAYGDADQSHELAMRFNGATETLPYEAGAFSGLQVALKPKSSQDPLVLFADTETATSFFAPPIPAESPRDEIAKSFKNFFQFGTNDTVLVGGPHLVRNATISRGVLALRGDLNASVDLTLVVPTSVHSVTWNSASVYVLPTFELPDVKILRGSLTTSVDRAKIMIPKISGWRFRDSLPEIQPGFDDSQWVVADHTETNLTQKMEFGDGRVLYGCDYGFCTNMLIWRGHFDGTAKTSAVNLTVNGGAAFATSVWINGKFVNTTSATPAFPETNALYAFPEGSVRVDEDNVLTVLQDHMGLDLTPTQRSPRGIRGFALDDGNFSTWKIQGHIGGYSAFPDKTRGVLNEGGLFGEREGWHLPGFNTSHWDLRALSKGLPNGNAGVGFFVTTFDLRIPRGVDASMSFVFDGGNQTVSGDQGKWRALLFVNGWQFGKRIAYLGPQARFPVPEGILEYDGTNTIAIALWVQDPVQVSPSLELELDYAVDGGVGPIRSNNPRWGPRHLA